MLTEAVSVLSSFQNLCDPSFDGNAGCFRVLRLSGLREAICQDAPSKASGSPNRNVHQQSAQMYLQLHEHWVERAIGLLRDRRLPRNSTLLNGTNLVPSPFSAEVKQLIARDTFHDNCVNGLAHH